MKGKLFFLIITCLLFSACAGNGHHYAADTGMFQEVIYDNALAGVSTKCVRISQCEKTERPPGPRYNPENPLLSDKIPEHCTFMDFQCYAAPGALPAVVGAGVTLGAAAIIANGDYGSSDTNVNTTTNVNTGKRLPPRKPKKPKPPKPGNGPKRFVD